MKKETFYHQNFVVTYSYLLRNEIRLTEKLTIYEPMGGKFEYTPNLTMPPEPIFDLEKLFYDFSSSESKLDFYMANIKGKMKRKALN